MNRLKKLANPINRLTSFVDSGLGNFSIYLHFAMFKVKEASLNNAKTNFRFCINCSHDLAKMHVSSKKVKAIRFFLAIPKIRSISFAKYFGAPTSPNVVLTNFPV